MRRLITFAALGALLVAAPSVATNAEPRDEATVSAGPGAGIAKAEEAPARRRRTTLERWRGGPTTLGAASDTLIRHEALDKNLPLITQSVNIAATPTF